jgi:hypothetical protein
MLLHHMIKLNSLLPFIALPAVAWFSFIFFAVPTLQSTDSPICMFTNTHRPFPALSNFCWPTNCSRESSVVPFFWHGRCVHGKWDPGLSSQRWVIMLHGRNVREVCWGTGVSGFWAFLAFVGHFDTWKIMSQDFFYFRKVGIRSPTDATPHPRRTKSFNCSRCFLHLLHFQQV